MDDGSLKLFLFLLIFWGFFLGITAYFAPFMSVSSTANTDGLDNAGSTTNFAALFDILLFRVEGAFPVFIGIILWIMTALTVMMGLIIAVKIMDLSPLG